MPAIPYASDSGVWTAGNLNALYAEADRKVSAVLTKKSLFMARRWAMTGVPLGRIVSFKGGTPKRMDSGIWWITGSDVWPATHNQSAVATQLARIQGGSSGLGYTQVLDTPHRVAYCDRYVNSGSYTGSAAPDLSTLMGSMIPLTITDSGTTYSVGVGIAQTTPAGKVSCANQGSAAGFLWHFRAHPLAVAELCFDGVTSYTVPATWTRFNLFRVHNLQAVNLTITFGAPGGDLTLTLGPWESRTVRRLADGSFLHEWSAGVPCRYFWPYQPGDAAFWRHGGGNTALGSTLTTLSPEANSSAGNVGNVSLLVDWFTALGQEMDPSVAADISGKYGQFFGSPSTGRVADLRDQFGRIQRVRSVSGVWTLQSDAYVADAAGVATALAAVGGTADGFGNWTMPGADALDGPGCSLFGPWPVTSGTVWPGTAPDVVPHDAWQNFLGAWQLFTFASGSSTAWRSAYKTSSPANFSVTSDTLATSLVSAVGAVATCSGWTMTPFGWSFQVTQTTALASGFDLIPFGSIFDSLSSTAATWTRRLWFTQGRDVYGWGTWPSLAGPAVIPPGEWLYLLKTSADLASDNQWAEWAGGKWNGSNGTDDATVMPQNIVTLDDRTRLLSPPNGATDGRKTLIPDPVAAFRHPSSGPFPLPAGAGGYMHLRIPLSAWQWDVLAYVVNAWTRGVLAVDWFDFPIRYRTPDGGYTANTGAYSEWMPLAVALRNNFEHTHNTSTRPSGDLLFYRVPADGVFRVNASISSEWGMTASTYTRTTTNSGQTATLTRNLSYVKLSDFLTFMAGQGLYGFGVRYGGTVVYEPLLAQYPLGSPVTYWPAGTLPYEGVNDGLVNWLDTINGGAATELTSPLYPLNELASGIASHVGSFGPSVKGSFNGEDGFVFAQVLPAGWTSRVKRIDDRWEGDGSSGYTVAMTAATVTPDGTFQNQGNTRAGVNPNVVQTVIDLSYVDLS